MREGGGAQFVLGLGEGDVEAAFAIRRAGAQEIERERGLAGAGLALQQVDMAMHEPAAEDIVQARNAGREHGSRNSSGHSVSRGRYARVARPERGGAALVSR